MKRITIKLPVVEVRDEDGKVFIILRLPVGTLYSTPENLAFIEMTEDEASASLTVTESQPIPTPPPKVRTKEDIFKEMLSSQGAAPMLPDPFPIEVAQSRKTRIVAPFKVNEGIDGEVTRMRQLASEVPQNYDSLARLPLHVLLQGHKEGLFKRKARKQIAHLISIKSAGPGQEASYNYIPPVLMSFIQDIPKPGDDDDDDEAEPTVEEVVTRTIGIEIDPGKSRQYVSQTGQEVTFNKEANLNFARANK